MEGHVIVHLPTLTLTVTVPVGTMDPTARMKVFTSTPHPCKKQLIHKSYNVIHIGLQSVHLPVRMEESVIVHYSTLTVPVPVGTQDPTART